jgi:hypothetical protein
MAESVRGSRGQPSAELTRRELLAAAAALGTALPAPARALDATMNPTPGVSAERKAWEDFCDALHGLGPLLDTPAAKGDAVTRAEGVRALARLAALGLERIVELADPRHPDFFELQTPVRKYMGDNPDQTYRVAAIEGDGTYRVRGTAAGAVGVEIGVYAGGFSSGQRAAARRLVAMIDENQLTRAPDASFELVLSAREHAGNWIRLEPDCESMLIRTYFHDRALRRAHAMPTIVREDAGEPAPPLALAVLSRRLLGVAAFVEGSLVWWQRMWLRLRGLPPNRLTPMPDDGTVQTPAGVRYLEGLVKLARNEALVIDVAPREEPAYWSFVLQNAWGETPDWRDRPVVLNNRELLRGRDGRVRLVVAHRDPHAAGVVPAAGVPPLNWMDMAGHEELLLALRWRGRSSLPETRARVQPFTESGRA